MNIIEIASLSVLPLSGFALPQTQFSTDGNPQATRNNPFEILLTDQD